MAKPKNAERELEPEEALRLAGYPAETAHGVNPQHPDETVEEYAARVRAEPEQAVKEQRELVESQKIEGAAEETQTDG